MLWFVLRRLGSALVLILLVLTLTFCLSHIAPGGPGGVYLDSRIPADYTDTLRELYGFDRPLPVRYFQWLKAILLHWDWGVSPSTQRPVSELLAIYGPQTAVLSAAALLVQFTFGLLFGVTAARSAERLADHLIRIFTVVLYGLPVFWLALMAILFFSHTWPLFPPGHTHSIDSERLALGARLLDRLHHLILPALVLGLASFGSVARLLRNSLVDVLGQDYVRTARAKGLAERRVVWVHALRNALAPLTQLLGLSLPFLVGGALVVERVFAWPGMGRLTWDAIGTRDYPVLLATTALAALVVVIGNLIADLLLAAIDPRVAHEG